MFGLAILLIITPYLLISLLVIWAFGRAAAKNGRKPWRYRLLAAFIMYNLVFWDWIPTYLAVAYYCKTQGGYTVYKSRETWLLENPEFASKFDDDKPPEGAVFISRKMENANKQQWTDYYEMPDGMKLRFRYEDGRYSSKEVSGLENKSGHFLNSRVYKLYTSRKNAYHYINNSFSFLSLNEMIMEYVDIKTGEVLARHVNFRGEKEGSLISPGPYISGCSNVGDSLGYKW
jgi:hypothetical protein